MTAEDGVRAMPGVRKLVREAAAYAPGERRPLRGYVAIMGTYAAFVAGAAGLARASGRQLPEDVRPWDLALLSLATHKITRIVTKDSITSPLRAPFTRYEGPAGPAELNEQVRDDEGRVRHAVGELVTCPFCLGVWTSTVLSTGMVFAPRATRVAAGVFATVAVSDFLHFAHCVAERKARG